MALCSVATLLDDASAGIWRADTLASAASAATPVLPSGHAVLDAQLPGGGWPVGGLCEVLQRQCNPCEWRLLLPALGAVSAGNGQKIVLLGAPYVPFGPALAAQGLDTRALLWVKTDAGAERLWAAEQALRCTGVAALLLWLPQARAEHLRRLQLAAQVHAKHLWVMRPVAAQVESSPAVLRLCLDNAALAADVLEIRLLKRRGPPLAQTLTVPTRPVHRGWLLAEQPVAGLCEVKHHALDRFAAAA